MFPPKRPDFRLALIAAIVWVIQAIACAVRGQQDASHLLSASLAPSWWRDAFARVVADLPGAGGELVPGLTLGDTSHVSTGLQAAMRTASLTHLTAVSGANCAIVIASVMAMGALCGAPLWLRSMLGVAALGGFVCIVGFQPSVIRAAAMATVLIIAHVIGRPGSGLPVLSLAVIVLLLAFPSWALSAGFVLSVAATAALLLLAPALAARWSERIGKRWSAVLAVPVAAQIVCQPIVILLAPNWPTFGVIANVLADPLAPLATMIGMIAFVVAPVLPPVAAGLGWAAWLPAQGIGLIASGLSALPWASLPWLEGIPGFVAATMTSVSLAWVLLSFSGRRRRIALCLVAVTLGLSLVSAVVSSVRVSVTRPSNWTIAACDVGQGDGLLVRGIDSEGRARFLLIDTGRFPEKLTRCLRDLNITTLDAVVLTHFDMDHAGAVEATYGHTTRAVISAPLRAQDTWTVRDMAAHGIAVERARAGSRLDMGNVRIDVLWPRPENPDMQGGNPGSIALRVQSPHFSAIFLADLGQEAQDALLSAYPGLTSVDVLKVAHHGSADQSENLLTRLHPRIALISVGRDNGYGHPTRRTLQILERLGTAVERTDRQGMILVVGENDDLTVWNEFRARGAS